jgi:alpha-tubulin suppressor-like RCC1 family protein
VSAGANRFVQVVLGAAHTCALTTEGAAFCWGANDRGQLGDGTTTERPQATKLKIDGKIADLVAADLHTCARLEDGNVQCWGDNRSGQLGDGTTQQRTSPVLVKW